MTKVIAYGSCRYTAQVETLAAGDDDLPGAPEVRLPDAPRKPELPKRPTGLRGR